MTVEAISQGGINVIITGAVFLAIATVTIVLRFVARKRIRSIGIDDWMSLASYVFLISVMVCHFIQFGPYGYAGAPLADFSPLQLRQFLIMLFANNIVYLCCNTSIKICILLLYRRIFVTRVFGIITTSLASLLIIWSLCVLLLQVFLCRPISTFWAPTSAKKECLDARAVYWAIAVSNVIWDFIMLLLPLPMIWRLNTTKKRKLQLCGVFLIGIFVCICSVLRAVVLRRWKEDNLTETVWGSGIWTVQECAVGIICTCIPPLANLFKEWHQKATRVYQKHLASNDAMPLQLTPSANSRGFGTQPARSTPDRAHDHSRT